MNSPPVFRLLELSFIELQAIDDTSRIGQHRHQFARREVGIGQRRAGSLFRRVRPNVATQTSAPPRHHKSVQCAFSLPAGPASSDRR